MHGCSTAKQVTQIPEIKLEYWDYSIMTPNRLYNDNSLGSMIASLCANECASYFLVRIAILGASF